MKGNGKRQGIELRLLRKWTKPYTDLQLAKDSGRIKWNGDIAWTNGLVVLFEGIAGKLKERAESFDHWDVQGGEMPASDWEVIQEWAEPQGEAVVPVEIAEVRAGYSELSHEPAVGLRFLEITEPWSQVEPQDLWYDARIIAAILKRAGRVTKALVVRYRLVAPLPRFGTPRQQMLVIEAGQNGDRRVLGITISFAPGEVRLVGDWSFAVSGEASDL